jgi:hypothetical protein
MLKSIGENKDFVESFKREAQAVARLNHPSIVQIYSFGQEKGQPFIVMELVSGERFDKMVESQKALDQALVMRIGLDIAEGLKAADEAGLLHGDIKPENILLDDKMHAKLVDFGIASFANQGQSEGIWGTPYYIAPEKVRRQKVDCRSDIYSLGATLFHALSGHPPFEGKTPVDVVKARLQHPARELHLVRPDIDPLIEKIIARMLEGDQNRRYPTYNSLISDMRKAIQKLGAPGVSSGSTSEIVRKTGVFTVGKKRSTSSIPSSNPDVPPPQPTRLVIHKTTKSPITTTGAAVPDPLAEIKKKATTSSKKGGSGKRIAVPLLLIIVVLVLGGGGTWLGVHISNKKKTDLAQKKEAYFLKKEKEKIDGVYRKVLVTTSNVIALAKGTQAFVDQATNAVFVVLNEPLDLPEAPPEVAAPPPTEQPKKEEPEKAAPPPAAAPVTPDPVKKKIADGIPPEVESRVVAQPPPKAEVAPAPAKTNEAPKAAEPAKTNETPAKAEPPVVEPPKRKPPPPNEPEPKPTARKVIAAVEKLTANAAAAQELQTAATATRDEALAAKTSVLTAVRIKILNENVTAAEALEMDSKSSLDDAKKALKKVAEMAASRMAALEAERKAAEKRAKDDAAREEEKKKQEALKKLAENELTLVEAARNNCKPMLVQHKYKDIVDALTAQTGAYQTDEGKAAFKALIDRYTRLQKMRTFIIAQLNADPFQWGLVLPKIGAVDVIGADETNVKIKDRSIPWTEISTAQMKKFLDHYLASQKLTVKVLAEQNLAAAIFCVENGGAKAAPPYVEKAVDLSPDLQEEAKRLVPLE